MRMPYARIPSDRERDRKEQICRPGSARDSASFHRYALCQISRLVDGTAPFTGKIICKELKRYDGCHGCGEAAGLRDPDQIQTRAVQTCIIS